MNKLLSAEFTRLFKSTLFKICVFISGILGVALIVPRWIDVKKNAETYANLPEAYSKADDMLFAGAMIVIFVMATFIGLFIGAEYSDGAIRNKLIVGHKRSNIYISKLIVSVMANIIMNVVCIIVSWGLGSLLLGVIMGYGEILKKTIMICVVVISSTALLLLFSMLIQSKSVGSVACLIFTIVGTFIASYIQQRLDATEYYDEYPYYMEDEYAFVNEETDDLIEVDYSEKNPFYVEGLKRNVYEFLFDFIPYGQMFQICYGNPENIGLLMLYDIIILVGSTSAGIIIFKKKNLK